MKRFWVVALVAAVCGCASNESRYIVSDISERQLASLAGTPFQLKVSETPGFVYFNGADQAAMTVGVFFGVVGAVIGGSVARSNAKARGAALATEDGFADPTPMLADRIRAIMQSRYGAQEGNSGLTVSVSTLAWGVRKDTVTYRAKVDLVADGSKEPIGSGECRYLNASNEQRPSEDELMADKGSLLKREMEFAINACADALDRKLFVAIPGG